MSTPPGLSTQLGSALIAENESGSLTLQVCDDCHAVQYPPREVCRRCLSDRLRWQAVDRSGTVLAATTLHASVDPWFRDRLPLTVVTVQLSAGPTVICHADSKVCRGSEVAVRFRHGDNHPTGLVAVEMRNDA